MAKPNNNTRLELDVNLLSVILGALVLTAIIYLIVFPFQDSYIGQLLYERGFTQYLTVFSACLVATITLNKYLKINQEKKVLKKLGIPDNIDFSNHKSMQLISLQADLARNSSMVTKRLARVFSAYIESGSRKTVAEFALDDSSFYLSASESSFTLPRIIVWAIPLLGFIGTVIGISSAVSGFTSFLDNTAEIEQIKQGIGSVTGGLAVAFDTTLLALLLSVVVMIPLVLVEKMESQILLATDIYVNDNILPRLNDTSSIPPIDQKQIVETVATTIKDTLPNKEEFIKPIQDALPSPQELVAPAETYAKQVATKLVSEVMSQFQNIHLQEEELINGIKEIKQTIVQDRQNFVETFGQQNNLNQSIIHNVKELIELVQANNQQSQDSLKESTLAISQQLNLAANNLQAKVSSLEKSSSNIAQLTKLQSHLDQIVAVLNTVDGLQNNLSGIKEQIASLEPSLRDLSKPKVIKLVEQIEQ